MQDGSGENVEAEVVTATPEEIVDDSPAGESVEQTVERAVKELTEKADAEESKTQPSEPAEKGASVEAASKPEVSSVDIEPPARMTAAQKEEFSKLPPAMKQATKKMFDDVNRYFSQGSAELQKAIKESYGIAEVIKPKLAEWQLSNYTPQEAVAHLCAAHELLLKKPEDALLWLANERQVDLQKLAAMQRGEAPQTSSLPPQKDDLRDKVEFLYNRTQQAETERFERTKEKIVAELREVRDEKDQRGQYLYPEMHEPGFFERAKPLVSAIQQASGVSWGDALKRAYASLTGKPLQLLPQAAKVPVTPAETLSAKSAGLSVRGKNGNQPAFKMPEQVPDSIEDTVRLAYQIMSRG